MNQIITPRNCETRSPRIAILSVSLLLVTSLGCRTTNHRFTALMPNQPPVGSVIREPPPKPPANILTKTRDIGVGGLKLVGGATVWLGISMLKSSLKDDDDEHQDRIDGLWREGYGFNNPNNERIANGQPVLNFDGSVHK